MTFVLLHAYFPHGIITMTLLNSVRSHFPCGTINLVFTKSNLIFHHIWSPDPNDSLAYLSVFVLLYTWKLVKARTSNCLCRGCHGRIINIGENLDSIWKQSKGSFWMESQVMGQ